MPRNSQIKWLCPVCGENRKAPVTEGGTRTSPLRAACSACDSKRKKLLREQEKRVRDFITHMRTIG